MTLNGATDNDRKICISFQGRKLKQMYYCLKITID